MRWRWRWEIKTLYLFFGDNGIVCGTKGWAFVFGVRKRFVEDGVALMLA